MEKVNQNLQHELKKLKETQSQPTNVVDDKQIEDRVQTLLRRQERQTHLLFEGICENPTENILEQVRVILYNTQINLDRSSVCKSNPNCKKVRINERLDDEQKTQRMELGALADRAKEKQREVRVVGDTLIVSDFKYKHSDINKLPDDISLQEAFTHIDRDYIFFNSEHSFLSAFYPAELTYKHQNF